MQPNIRKNNDSGLKNGGSTKIAPTWALQKMDKTILLKDEIYLVYYIEPRLSKSVERKKL